MTSFDIKKSFPETLRSLCLIKYQHILLNIRDDQRILYENTDFTITPQHLGVIVREQNITRKKNN